MLTLPTTPLARAYSTRRAGVVRQGFEAEQQCGVYIDDTHLDAFDKYKVLFKGPLTVPPGDSKK